MNSVAIAEMTAPIMVGVVREAAPGERRVALTPTDVKRVATRTRVLVEQGAGESAGYSDAHYVEAGARIVDAAQIRTQADLLLAVRPPAQPQVLRRSSALISLGGRDAAITEALAARGVLHLGLERIPRTTRAQSMDVLSSQASISGYASVIEGARLLDVLLPMLTTAAGIVRPAKMIALGAGVAGLQAIATARRLGAVVHGFDVREAAREQVESLGARFVFPEVEVSAEGNGGYAAAQSDAQQEQLRRALAAHVAQMQLVISSAQIPGKRAPILIDKQTVHGMAPGSVIVDLAAESGGNSSLTRADEIVEENGVRIYGPTNLPSLMATDASRLFGANVRALLEHLIDADGRLHLDPADDITGALLAGQAATPTFPLAA
ncbi:NAD(P) transhydrogenase subunit alpha [Lysobacter niabensis]|uniref:proton-translocating NAD(P)(+) transhydrogenase n=1 Tax=Agrilutibacter niabensis TaxID=380628 RepID=A0ABU1VLK1_9GAMM|nr:NAD(P) transhydrogenase subunit alpha [Lysobacter niabensis]MDR7098369.1 NAD(P) transhydrogenase subunit alpha [Lysobacter niabensis]